MCGYSSHLVVIGEGYDGGADPEYHGRVYLTVCVCGAVCHTLLLEFLGCHGQHDGLLLKGVYVLNHAAGHQVLPTTHTHTGNNDYRTHKPVRVVNDENTKLYMAQIVVRTCAVVAVLALLEQCVCVSSTVDPPHYEL